MIMADPTRGGQWPHTNVTNPLPDIVPGRLTWPRSGGSGRAGWRSRTTSPCPDHGEPAGLCVAPHRGERCVLGVGDIPGIADE
jgi:hypothetical protein